jgi:DNA primase
VAALAQDVGLPVPESAQEPDRPKPPPALWDALEQAARFYKQQLKQSPRAIDYLKRRGLTGAIAARYGIGYAPDGSPLKQVFKDYAAEALAASGLVVENEGRRYDRFRDRIMFPIRNAKGQIVGFGGRVLDQGEPKYLNSPETPLFEKGRELFGLPQARQSLRETNTAIVTEGYMDVIALAQNGVGNAVATLGTATTPTHVQKLLRQVDRIVFSFDGDNAGRKAAWRALENALEALADNKQIGFVFLPAEHDPDSFIR